MDPDVAPPDLSSRAPRRELPITVAVVFLGGVLGALARYEVGKIWSTAPGTFPWATFVINATGCALMGVLVVLVTEALTAHRLVRPFLGTGILGGFTTFSTYANDTQHLLDQGHPALALTYFLATAVTAVLAVAIATWVTRSALGVAGRGAQS